MGLLRPIKVITTVLVVAGAAMLITGSLSDVEAKTRWKLQTAYPPTFPVLGEVIVDVIDNVNKMSGGEFEIKLHPPGALVKTMGIFDAISRGSIEAGFAGTGFWPGKEPALAVLNAIPFGPGLENVGWMISGGGKEIANEIFAKYNMVGLPCGLLEPEAAGWFRKEIKSTEDFNGMKMRISGLGGKTLEKFGLNSMVMGGGEIYPNLERGVIDAAEFTMPMADRKMGFEQIAKYYYLPGWHQPATWLFLMINKDAWEKLPDEHKLLLETACHAGTLKFIAKAQAGNADAVDYFKGKGVNVMRWSDEMLEEFRKAWEEVAAEESAKNELFKKAYESQKAFQEKYQVWKDYGYVN